jgi:hypothetical protein
MQALPGDYFAVVQPFQHHSGTTFRDGGVDIATSPDSDENAGGGAWNPYSGQDATTEPKNGGVYMYSFAIKPEEHQPSGTCNFSRIDTATLVFSIDGAKKIGLEDQENADIRVYAINYNILRIMSGMGGLAYSN